MVDKDLDLGEGAFFDFADRLISQITSTINGMPMQQNEVSKEESEFSIFDYRPYYIIYSTERYFWESLVDVLIIDA